MNVYEVLNYLGIKLKDAGHVKYPPGECMEAINDAISEVSSMLLKMDQEYFTGSVTMTPSSSGVELPDDYVFAVELSDDNGPIRFGNSLDRFSLSLDDSAYSWLYDGVSKGDNVYIRGNKIYFPESATKTHTLFYARAHPLVHAARPAAVGTATITFPAARNLGWISDVDDYYNQATIDIISGTGVGTSAKVLDYVGLTRVATLTADWPVEPDTDSKYQIRCELPVYPNLHRIVCRLAIVDLLDDEKKEKRARMKLHNALETIADRQTQNSSGQR